ncbi:MAG: efflux RND transporter periplasmic adaptor subunit [Steroidobacteraceae bacterium]|jgi:RND family efflux transporter MFP subunit|nr:efflux RND transporter periplasmic adaptor subunit [Steroidobacteraceae bacterium]
MNRAAQRASRVGVVAVLATMLALSSFAGEPKLEFSPARLETTPLERMLDGVIEAVNQGTVSAQTSGRVAEVLYDVNDFVPADAVIIRLRGAEQRATLEQANAALKEAIAREAEAQARYSRVAGLFKDNAASRQQLDTARAERDAAVARLAGARAAVESAREEVNYTEIRAPYAGVVTQRHVEVGESVRPGAPLMSGLSLQQLRVSVDLPQSLVRQVREIGKAAVYIDGRRIPAVGVTIFPQAAPQSNTFRARVELPENAADLYPGMFVKVGFVVGEAERLLTPVQAVVERSEVTAVYVLDESDTPRLRQVRLGRVFGEHVDVLAGLSPGERVALDPAAAVEAIRRASAAE